MSEFIKINLANEFFKCKFEDKLGKWDLKSDELLRLIDTIDYRLGKVNLKIEKWNLKNEIWKMKFEN